MFQSTNIKKGIPSTNFDAWTVRIFSSKNATAQQLVFFVVKQTFFQICIILCSCKKTKQKQTKKNIKFSSNLISNSSGVFFIFLWTAESVGIWLLGTPGHTNGAFFFFFYYIYFSMNFYGIKIWRPMLLTNNSIVSNILDWHLGLILLSFFFFFFFENDKLLFY